MKILKVINHIKIVPRWIIFALDMCIATVAFICAYLIFHNFSFTEFRTQNTATLFFFTLGATAVSFTSFRLYLGIIRYTSAVDSIRILSTVLFAQTLLFTSKLVFVVFNIQSSINTQFIIVYGLLLFLVLIIYRTSIKVFFQYTRTIKKTKKN